MTVVLQRGALRAEDTEPSNFFKSWTMLSDLRYPGWISCLLPAFYSIGQLLYGQKDGEQISAFDLGDDLSAHTSIWCRG